MKRLTLCILTVITFTINAQDKKPTKAQTIEFIKDYFKGGITTVSSEKTPSSLLSRSYEFSEFDFQIADNSTVLTVSYNEKFDYSYINHEKNLENTYFTYRKCKYVIDLKKIEHIDFRLKTAPSGVSEPIAYTIFLNFKTIPGYSVDTFMALGERNIGLDKIQVPDQPIKKSEVTLVANFFQAEANFDISIEGNNKKILQAFNHLRKLCGAPEPISFD